MEKLKVTWLWFKQTSTVIGAPMMLVLLIVGMQKFVFTATCLSAGYQCKYAFGVSEMAQQYLSNLVGGTSDIEVKPRK